MRFATVFFFHELNKLTRMRPKRWIRKVVLLQFLYTYAIIVCGILEHTTWANASSHSYIHAGLLLEFGGYEKPALVHYTVTTLIFVAGARARRDRRNDHLIDAGSTITVVISRARFNAASTFGTAAPSMAIGRCAMSSSRPNSVRGQFGILVIF